MSPNKIEEEEDAADEKEARVNDDAVKNSEKK